MTIREDRKRTGGKPQAATLHLARAERRVGVAIGGAGAVGVPPSHEPGEESPSFMTRFGVGQRMAVDRG